MMWAKAFDALPYDRPRCATPILNGRVPGHTLRLHSSHSLRVDQSQTKVDDGPEDFPIRPAVVAPAPQSEIHGEEGVAISNISCRVLSH